jgi:hypothetical protein
MKSKSHHVTGRIKYVFQITKSILKDCEDEYTLSEQVARITGDPTVNSKTDALRRAIKKNFSSLDQFFFATVNACMIKSQVEKEQEILEVLFRLKENLLNVIQEEMPASVQVVEKTLLLNTSRERLAFLEFCFKSCVSSQRARLRNSIRYSNLASVYFLVNQVIESNYSDQSSQSATMYQYLGLLREEIKLLEQEQKYLNHIKLETQLKPHLRGVNGLHFLKKFLQIYHVGNREHVLRHYFHRVPFSRPLLKSYKGRNTQISRTNSTALVNKTNDYENVNEVLDCLSFLIQKFEKKGACNLSSAISNIWLETMRIISHTSK